MIRLVGVRSLCFTASAEVSGKQICWLCIMSNALIVFKNAAVHMYHQEIREEITLLLPLEAVRLRRMSMTVRTWVFTQDATSIVEAKSDESFEKRCLRPLFLAQWLSGMAALTATATARYQQTGSTLNRGVCSLAEGAAYRCWTKGDRFALFAHQ